MSTVLPPVVDGAPAGDVQTPVHRSNRWARSLALCSLLAVVGVAAAFGSWDATTGVWFLDLLVWGGLGGAFVALVDGMVTGLKWLLVGFFVVLRRRSAARRLRALRTSPLSFPLAALWFALGWRIVPEESVFGFARAGAVGSLIIISITAAGLVWGVTAASTRPWLRALVALLVPLLTIGWLWWPGTGSSVGLPDTGISMSELEDPGRPGPWPVLTTTYGSGQDRHRAEYGADVGMVTETVDGSALWPGPSGPVGVWWRWYWGFDAATLPVDGLVWYPEGEGSFPLVLIVHGNHTATHASDPGYAYLGEHLASRGFIVASVDENFLNGSALFEPSGAEMAARAWLLTEHLAQWQRWTTDSTNSFFGKVDMDRVILMGHSRGGEAAVHAAGMIDHACPPATGHVAVDVAEVTVVGVVAIAPSDGQYRPCGRLDQLRGIDFMTISGSSDADTEEFFGLAQFERIELDDDDFATSVYLAHATHGRFNSEWGLGDLGGFDAPLLDRASFLSETQQQRAALTLIGGFVEASAYGRDDYRSIFERPDSVDGLAPLLTTSFRTGDFNALDPRDQDAAGFDQVATKVVDLPDGYSTGDWVQRLRWSEAPGPAEAAYRFSARPLPRAIRIDLAVTPGQPPPVVTIRVDTPDGATGQASLTAGSRLREPVPRHFVKSTGIARALGLDVDLSETPETIFQTYAIPLAGFDWTQELDDDALISGLTLSFARDTAGEVLLDDVGFTN